MITERKYLEAMRIRDNATPLQLRLLALEALLVAVYPEPCCDACGKVAFADHADGCEFVAWFEIDKVRGAIAARLS